MRVPFLSMVVVLAAGLTSGHPSWSQDAPNANATPPVAFEIPDNLVLDLRLFESRAISPDLTVMESLNFFIMTDGRDVTAEQWPSTLAKKVPDSFLAALISDTAPVDRGVGRFDWTTGSRGIRTEIRVENYHPAEPFKAHINSQFLRGGNTVSQHARELELQIGRTLVWSSGDLEISASDYISHFREYHHRENRGLLYELLRPNTFFLIMTVTPRLLTEEEARQGPAQAFSLPPGAEIPLLENPSGVPLKGTIRLGFDLDAGGAPLNPQVLRSTFPEANLRVVAEAIEWQLPAPENASQVRRGEIEIQLEVP